MWTLCFALPLVTFALLLQVAVGPCDAATPPSLSVLNLPFGGSVMATDAHGNIFFTGMADQVFRTIPVTAGAAQLQPGGGICGQLPGPALTPGPCSDAYIVKVQVDSAGGKIAFGTLLGGDGNDVGTGIAVDPAGNVYVTGTTTGDFPTTPNALLRSLPFGTPAVFAAKLNPQGTQFIYATYLPLGSSDTLPSIVVDARGNAYITGETPWASQAFVAKLSPDGSLLYDTVLGGSGFATGLAITVDADGNAYVAGQTLAGDFVTSPGAFQRHLRGCPYPSLWLNGHPDSLLGCSGNAFVAKLDPAGHTEFATYLGGSGSEAPHAIQVDSAGYIYVAGATTSPDFPTTPGSYEPIALIPMSDSYGDPVGFAAKLSPTLDKLVYSTYIFSDAIELLYGGFTGLVPDNAGGSYLAGFTGPGMPVTASAPQPCGAGTFVTHLDQHGALLDRTYSGQGGTPVGLMSSGDRSVRLVTTGGDVPGLVAELHFGDPGTQAAACLSSGVLNAASFALAQVSPGEIISLTGFGIGPEQGVSYRRGADGSVPRQLAGVQVFFDDLPAPLLYVQSQQINAIAPFELAGHTTTKMRVAYNGAIISSVDVPVDYAAPGLFLLHAGFSTQAAALNEDGTINGPSNPAKMGSVVSLFGTGFGQSNPPGMTGALFPLVPAQYQASVAVWIDELLGEVLYAGQAPGELAGIGQINFRVPVIQNLTSNAVSVFVQLNEVFGTGANPTIFVK